MAVERLDPVGPEVRAISLSWLESDLTISEAREDLSEVGGRLGVARCLQRQNGRAEAIVIVYVLSGFASTSAYSSSNSASDGVGEGAGGKPIGTKEWLAAVLSLGSEVFEPWL